jgi:ABC-2 type transport system permease protein
MNKARMKSGNAVPSSLAQAGIIMKYTLLDYVKSRRFFILLAIVSGISAILTLVVGYSRYPIYDLWGSFAPVIAMFSGIFFGGDAISGEFQNKTGYFSIPNPIRRSSIYVGKWLSAFIASLIILGVFITVTVAMGCSSFLLCPPNLVCLYFLQCSILQHFWGLFFSSVHSSKAV